MHTSFKEMDTSSVLGKIVIDTEVLHIGNRDIILELSQQAENRFSVDTQDPCLKNVHTGQVIPCLVRWIVELLIMEAKPLEDRKILLIIDASE